ncbi:MAG: putative (Glutamate-ammonia-ligase) adenylyltransferase, subunit (modular protein) [Nitrospira sp.]|nr:putative (Glutamate-ammonia-ligase) adenylyltransferase, subunit (modular protein) [Nitrospira sp.]
MPPVKADRDRILATLTPLCRGIDADILQDFVTRMDPEYFSAFPSKIVAAHVKQAAALTPDHPCDVSIVDVHGGRCAITIVAYDYFSEFATICGLLSAFGLNIEEGQIYTFVETSSPRPPTPRANWTDSPRARPKGRPGLSRKKIVDVFRVQPVRGASFEPDERRRLMAELTAMIMLLDDNQFDEARQSVNRQLVEYLGQRRSAFSGLLHTVHITFDNGQSPTDTVMDIQSDDTPAFLYAFANALAMRDIYIAKAQFSIEDGKLHDRFYVRNRHGQKLTDPVDQQHLRLTAVLIKQFTHALTWAPDPAKALEAFDQFLDLTVQDAKGKAQQQALAFLSDKKTFPLLARLLGTSDFLWEDFLRRQHGNLLPLLKGYRDAPLIKPQAALRKELDRVMAKAKTDDSRKETLNRFKDQELFRIDMKHMADASSLADFSEALTELAEVIVGRSLRDCQVRLEKQYGDIEVLFVYGGAGRTSGKQGIENSEYFERLAQELLQRIEAKQEGIFHIDVRLRPHGGKGSLANAFEELCTYYSAEGQAAPFERQALIKLRHIAGDPSLGKKVETHRDSFVYSGAPWDLTVALDLRRQQVKQLVESGQVNLKHSHGGIVTLEYAIQYLQVMHGHRYPNLRTPNTLRALAALIDVGLIPRATGENLRKSYLFIRMLIDGLRMVRGNTKDLVLPPPDSDEFIFLARRVGYQTEDWQAGARHLQTDIDEHMGRTKEFFERTFGRL